MTLTNFIFFISGVVVMVFINKFRSFLRHVLLMIQHKKVFTDVLDQIGSDKTVFINRVNNNVTLDMRIKTYGKIVLFYDMDQRLLAISKDNNIILLSSSLSEHFPDLVETICDNIETRWHKEIEDVIEVNGVIVNKEYLENSAKKNMEDNGFMGVSITLNPHHNITEENLTAPDIEETINNILDKIHTSGMESLTPEEKEFLEKYGKG